MRILKTADFIENQQMFSPLEGKTRAQARKIVQNIINKLPINGLFSDTYWQGPKMVWEALTENNIDWVINNSQYKKDEKGNPISKQWIFEIEFVNQRSKPDKLTGQINAYGAGSIQQPLDKYDMTAIVF